MSTTTGSRDYGRFDELAEEFAGRYRRGERPGLQEYVDRLPEMADEIREMFPAMVEVERADGEVRGEKVPLSPSFPHGGQVGDYRILREVGRGGMGVVYEAEQISLGRRVALKVLPGHVTGDRQALARFQREAKSAARLHHTNIVPVFEVGRDRDVSFYAMQLIQGQGLDQVFEELRRLREPGPKANGHEPPQADALEVVATNDRPQDAATSILQKQALALMTANLLTGGLVAEGPEGTTRGEMAATGLAQTERFDPAATSGLASDVPVRALPPASIAPGSSSSAVMPGGKHVSELDTSGRRQPFFRSVAQIGRQAAQGLAYAHARGIVHRDIKPSNLLLDTEGVVWITDFGLAKADDDGLTASGDILGTLRYMAPERFRGEGDARADIYALGLTLYELLTLRPAYDSTDRLRLIERIKNEEPARPRSIDPQIPRDLETVVLKAIDKHPDHRYPTAAALSEDLRRFLADEPIKARQVSASERYWRWARRNPAVATLGGVLTAVLVLVTVGSLVVAGRMAALADNERFAATSERQARQEARRQAEAEAGARAEAEAARDRARASAVRMYRDRGFQAYEQGKAGEGLLWHAHALAHLPPNATGEREEMLRHAGAWFAATPPLGSVHLLGNRNGTADLAPDGSRIVRSDGRRAVVEPVDRGGPAGAEFTCPPGDWRIADVRFLGEGRPVAVTTLHDHELRVWDVLTGTPLGPPVAYEGHRIEVAFDRGGRVMAVGGAKRVFRYTIADGTPVGEPLDVGAQVKAVTFNRAGDRLAVATDNNFTHVFDWPVGTKLRETNPSPTNVTRVLAMAYSPTAAGRLAIGTHLRQALAWNAEVGTLDGSSVLGGQINAVCWSADGRTRFYGADDGYVTAVRDDLPGGNQRWPVPFRHGGPVKRLVVSADGRTLLSVGDGAARRWRLPPVAEGFGAAVWMVTAAGWGGDRIVVADASAVRLVDPSGGPGAELMRVGGEPVTAAVVTPDATAAVVFDRAGRGTILGLPDGRVLGRVRCPPQMTEAAFVPGNPRQVVVWGDKKPAALIDFDRPDPVATLPCDPADWEEYPRVAVMPGSVVFRVESGRLSRWEPAADPPLRYLVQNSSAMPSVLPVADRLYVGSEKNALLVFDAAGRHVGSFDHPGTIWGMASDPAGREVLTAGNDGRIRRLDATTGAVIGRPWEFGTAPVMQVAWRAAGDLAAGNDRTCTRLFEAVAGRPIGPRWPTLVLRTTAFSPAGDAVLMWSGVRLTRIPVPAPIPDDVERLRLFVAVHFGLEVTENDEAVELTPEQWFDRYERWRADPRPFPPARERPATAPALPGGPTEGRVPPTAEVVVLGAGNIDPADLERAQSLLQSGVAASRRGHLADAALDLQRASERVAALRKMRPTDPTLARLHGISLGTLASSLRDSKRPGEALARCRESLAVYESMDDPNPGDLYNMACGCALVSELDGQGSPEDREKLEARAVEFLRRAIAGDKGLILPMVATDRDLDPVRRRADFGGVVADASFPSDPFAQLSPVTLSPATPGERKIRGEALIAEGRTLDAIPYLASIVDPGNWTIG